MKKLIIKLLALFFFLFAPVGVMAQGEVRREFREPGISLLNVGAFRATFSRLSWVPEGLPITACSFKMEELDDDGITWTELTPLQDCTSNGKLEFITPPLGTIRLNVSSLIIGQRLILFWDGLKGTACGLDYRGIFSTIVGPDPVAGAELSITVPQNERWRVYSSEFELQANSVVEDREVFLTASENGNEYFRTFADGVVKANQKGIFTTASLGFVGTTGLGPSSINQPTDVRTIMIPIYSDAFIPGGDTLATDTNGLQPGDDYGPVVIKVERCPN